MVNNTNSVIISHGYRFFLWRSILVGYISFNYLYFLLHEKEDSMRRKNYVCWNKLRRNDILIYREVQSIQNVDGRLGSFTSGMQDCRSCCLLKMFASLWSATKSLNYFPKAHIVFIQIDTICKWMVKYMFMRFLFV